MAYKYEIEQKANVVKVRVLIAVYVMFVVSSILIGVALRLQQIKDITPTAPKADTAGNPALFALSEASDPIYSVNQLKALAYCDVVDDNGNNTGVQLPLAAHFVFRQIIRDVGQYGSPLSSVCQSAIAGACDWKAASNDAARYLCQQTVAQCTDSTYTCDDNATAGAFGFNVVQLDSSAAQPMVSWPGANLMGNLIYDDNEVNVILNPNLGDLAGNTITRNGITYTLDKSQLQTVDTNSLFPIYRWRCNNDVCTSTGSCQNGNVAYSSDRCTFDSASRLFQCPQNKYIRYDVLTDNKTFYYSLTNPARAGQVAGDPTWVKAGYAYETLVDGTYANAVPADTASAAEAIAFKGNLIKYRLTCKAQTTVTTTPTPTITPTGSSAISARKTGPVCVERVSPYNTAVFTITISNGAGATSSTIINSVDDSLPQGFTYSAHSTSVNGVLVADTYVTTVNSGASQKITFAPPAGQTPWTLAPGQTMTITFTTLANGSAVTGTNTNHVVVVPEGGNAIDNISAQFEVAITCHPDTGVLDQPIVIFVLSAVFFMGGLYLLYSPKGAAMLQSLGDATAKVEKSLEEETDPKKRFEKRVLKKRSSHR